MKVNIVFVKPDGTVIPLESMTEQELQQQTLSQKKRFFESLGYVEKQKTA